MKMSIKTKVASIAAVVILVCIILLSLITMSASMSNAMEDAVNAQADELRVIDLFIQDTNSKYSVALHGLAETIESLPASVFEDDELAAKTIGPLLKTHRNSTGAFGSYIGLESGVMIEYDSDTYDQGKLYNVRGGKFTSDFDPRVRPWYQGAAEKKAVYQTSVYKDFVTGLPNMTYAYPVYKNGKLVGVVGVDILLSTLQSYFDFLKEESNSYLFVLDKDDIPYLATDQQSIMKESDIFKYVSAQSKKTADFEDFKVDDNGTIRIAQCKTSKDKRFAPYTLCSFEALENIEAPIKKESYTQILIGLLFALITSVIIFGLMSFFLRPLENIQKSLLSFFTFLNHETNTPPQPLAIKSQDELGEMARAINENNK